MPGLPQCCSSTWGGPLVRLTVPEYLLRIPGGLVTATSSSPPTSPLTGTVQSAQAATPPILSPARDLPSLSPPYPAQLNSSTLLPHRRRTIRRRYHHHNQNRISSAVRPNRPARLDSARPELPQLQSKLQPCSAQQLRGLTMRPSVRQVDLTAMWAVVLACIIADSLFANV